MQKNDKEEYRSLQKELKQEIRKRMNNIKRE